MDQQDLLNILTTQAMRQDSLETKIAHLEQDNRALWAKMLELSKLCAESSKLFHDFSRCIVDTEIKP